MLSTNVPMSVAPFHLRRFWFGRENNAASAPPCPSPRKQKYPRATLMFHQMPLTPSVKVKPIQISGNKCWMCRSAKVDIVQDELASFLLAFMLWASPLLLHWGPIGFPLTPFSILYSAHGCVTVPLVMLFDPGFYFFHPISISLGLKRLEIENMSQETYGTPGYTGVHLTCWYW
jgi:hypothetical protein